MAIYTVHAPASYGSDPRVTADKVVFVRDGFYVWAFLGTIVWMIWHRLWLALTGYIAISFLAEIGLRAIGVAADMRLLVAIALAFLVGLEAGTLRRWKLSRGKWQQLDVVSGKTEEEAERRFFDRAASVARDSGASGTMHPLPRSSLNAQNDVVGLFPQPGAPR